jgi:hypothetical protein
MRETIPKRREYMWPFDQNNQQMYQQYAQAYNTGNYNNIEPNQAMGHLQQFMRNAPPEMQHQVYQQYFQQMPIEQRQQFAQRIPGQYGMNPNDPYSMARGFQQAGQQQPNILSQVFSQFTGGNNFGGGGGGMGSSIEQKGLGMLVGMVANHVMNNQGGGGGMFGGGLGQL